MLTVKAKIKLIGILVISVTASHKNVCTRICNFSDLRNMVNDAHPSFHNLDARTSSTQLYKSTIHSTEICTYLKFNHFSPKYKFRKTFSCRPILKLSD